VSGTVTAAARKTGHLISFFITLAMMCLVVGFIWHTKKQRYGNCWQINGPLILVIMAVPLIMADLVRHLLQDHDIWTECPRNKDEPPWPSKCTWYSNQYRCTLHGPSSCIPDKNENMAHLSPMGVLFTIVCTYTGFGLLFFGVLWNANILKKCREIRSQWRELRQEW